MSEYKLSSRRLLKEKRKIDKQCQMLFIRFSAGCVKVVGDRREKKSVFCVEFEQSSFNSLFLF